MLYTTAGTARTVVAINPDTGAVLWKHVEDEGPRGQNAARSGAGRGVAYWSSANGSDQRIIYVTPGYRMIALDAKTGAPIPTFGQDGVVDLKLDNDQEIDLVTADLGLNATPLVAGDVVVVGAAHRFSGSPRTMNNARGYVRGFDVKDRASVSGSSTPCRSRASSGTTRGSTTARSTTETPAPGRSSAPISSWAWSTSGRDADRRLLRR